MVKLFVGLIKGAVIGAAIGLGAWKAELDLPWIVYGVVGALVGLICGKPIWALLRDKGQTNIIAILKAAFGFGIGCGLYALLRKAWNPSALMVSGFDVFSWPVSVGGAIGAIYGGFVELDDSIGGDTSGKKGAAPAPKKKLKATSDDE